MVVDVRLILLCLLLTACSPVDLIKEAVLPSKGLEVETELVVGDKKQEVAAGAVVGKREETNTHQQAQTITNNAPVTNEANPWWWSFLGGLLVGWVFLPDGLKMAQKVRSFFR